MLTICEKHGQAPSWWNTLSQDDMARLLAKCRFDRSHDNG